MVSGTRCHRCGAWLSKSLGGRKPGSGPFTHVSRANHVELWADGKPRDRELDAPFLCLCLICPDTCHHTLGCGFVYADVRSICVPVVSPVAELTHKAPSLTLTRWALSPEGLPRSLWGSRRKETSQWVTALPMVVDVVMALCSERALLSTRKRAGDVGRTPLSRSQSTCFAMVSSRFCPGAHPK